VRVLYEGGSDQALGVEGLCTLHAFCALCTCFDSVDSASSMEWATVGAGLRG
jgi:hypothetical protein